MSFDSLPDSLRNALYDWRSSMSEQETVMLDRYSRNADRTSVPSFLLSAATAALTDENYRFAASAAEECLRNEISDIQRFDATESLIEAHIGTKRYDDAKVRCEDNLSLYPYVSGEIKARNGGTVPERMVCRNRYIDILVGTESAYDPALELLDRFLGMGMISAEDHAFRRQSLKIHRLQRSFDGVYTYTYKE
ncbi:MAG: hypothetical protein LBV13_03655 [Methanomassiliicoccaceae archaeon]|jgi:hypothetical protein|nr:hypothetical protein [Methanomassiliicoccaceae archaeon]